MKTTALIAFAGVLVICGNALADAESLKETYIAGAFDGADDDWRRIIANRTRECGAFGANGARRIDILIARYEEVGEALAGGDDAAIAAAAQKFAKTAAMNERFEACWDKIAIKQGVSGKFKREAAKL